MSTLKSGKPIGAARRDFLHKESRKLVNRFGRIAFEDLNTKGLAGGVLAKHVYDASWAQLTAMTSYKAANAGGEVVMVDPRGTSQTCPECGTVAKKTLAERTHRCPGCGLALDRDLNAARNILRLGRSRRGAASRSGERRGSAKAKS